MLHIVMFPFTAHGHMIPTFDIAKLLAARNVKVTIITTPLNAPVFTTENPLINLEIFIFPAQEVGLPDGVENIELVMTDPEAAYKFFRAADMFEKQLELYFKRVQPDCLIADWLYPWATKCASNVNVPRIVFHGMSYFALCTQEILRIYEPYKNTSTDNETFTLPIIPHHVKMLRSQINPELMDNNNISIMKRMELMKKSEIESYGVIMNSFYELEPEYVRVFKDLGRKSWSIGPVLLCNRSINEKVQRGKRAAIDERTCLTWLDSKNTASVVYVCFGSTTNSSAPQLHAIAKALELSGKNFIWVVRNGSDIPRGFEDRTRGRGLLIKGWAPQVLILDHKAVAAFVTHCGWNSVLEGISAGVPMVTWPNFAEQFFNEKLVTKVLKVGVSVGVKKWSRVPCLESFVSSEDIEKAVMEITEGTKAEQMRQKAKKLKEMAWAAVTKGGSSHSAITVLIDDLTGFKSRSKRG